MSDDKDTKRRARDTEARESFSAPNGIQADKGGLRRQEILAGFEEGRYEPRRHYDRQLFGAHSAELMKRDNRVNIRVSGSDLDILHEEALRRGIPLQSLMAGIIRDYVSTTSESESVVETASQAVQATNSRTEHDKDEPGYPARKRDSIEPAAGRVLRFRG